MVDEDPEGEMGASEDRPERSGLAVGVIVVMLLIAIMGVLIDVSQLHP